jgi:hypothetical protein
MTASNMWAQVVTRFSTFDDSKAEDRCMRRRRDELGWSWWGYRVFQDFISPVFNIPFDPSSLNSYDKFQISYKSLELVRFLIWLIWWVYTRY